MFDEQNITDILLDNYMPYAMSVIVARAIPEIDGFKPSHRKLLYTMYKMGLLKGNRTKSSNVIGQTMKLNPHGDGSIYETLVRLTSGNESLLHPYIDSKGNMGKHYSRDMAYAAHRYTESKLSPICNELFSSIEKNTVDFVDNYDNTTTEPVLLPGTYPAILVNSNQGIAVGMASNICPFNLGEVCDATIGYINDKEINISDYIKGPDFPTGGELLYSKDEFDSIFATGTGSFKIKGVITIDAKKKRIEITEIPYSTTCEAIIDQIVDLVKSGKSKEVSDVRDETDLNGLKIAIDYKRTADPEIVKQKILSSTKIVDSFPCNFNILYKGEHMVLGVKDIIKNWLEFRRECLTRSIRFDLSKKQDSLHLLQGLEKVLLDIDKAIKIIRNTEKDKDVIPALCDGFNIDVLQATYVSEIKLRNLNKEYILNKTKDINSLIKEINSLNSTLKSKAKINRIIISDLERVKKTYDKPRLTKIVEAEPIQKVLSEEIIEDYNVKLFITSHNYIKKIPLTSLRVPGENKIKDDDEIILEKELKNSSEVLIFTNKFNVHKIKLFDIDDKKLSEFGDYAPTLIELEDGEEILFIHGSDDFTGHFLFVFENGKIAKIPVSSYQTKQYRKKLINSYSKTSSLVSIIFIEKDQLLEISTSSKKMICDTSLITEKSSKSSQGIQVMKVKNDIITYSSLISKINNEDEVYIYKNIPGVGKKYDKQLKFS